MARRKIVEIDEEKCDGCGDCIPGCPEGALQIIDGKAKLVSDHYCDGLGVCLGVCPRDAIRVIEREADQFDEEAVAEHLQRQASPAGGPHVHGGACPGAALMNLARSTGAGEPEDEQAPRSGGVPSALGQWPVQLHLVPVSAPFFEGTDVLLAADCVPFAMADFHAELLRGRKLLVGCPKLDDSAYYADKLAEILKQNDIRSLTVVHMEVPCCFGLMALARRALAESGAGIPVEEVTVGVGGEIKSREEVRPEPRVEAGNR
ncbi:MAG: ATP-binding protein [Planctomycetota bacterium]|jgi:Pyruvate/2-oxoacid:ferredoxin oxidoreductase delta subunit